MPKTKDQKFGEYIRSLFYKYRDELNLNNFQLTINNCWDMEINKENGSVTMSVDYAGKGYTLVEVSVFKPMYDDWVKKNHYWMERRVLHELIHVLLSDLKEQATSRYTSPEIIQKEEERLCENLSTIIHRLLTNK